MPDLDKAAQQLTSGSSQGTVEKDGLVSVPTSSKGTDVTPVKGAGAGTDRPAAAASSTATTKPAGTATTGSSAKAPPAAAGTTEKARAKKPGFAQRVIAIITCSSGARAMAEHEQLDEKRAGAAHGRSDAGRARTDGKAGGSALPAGVVVPPRTPNAKGGSRLGGDDGSSSVGPTTPGGGTRLPREETGDVMSGAVVPPGASYVAPGDVAAADGLAAGQHRKSRTSGDVSKTESDVDDDYDDDDDDDDDDDEDDEDGLAMDGDYLDDDDQTEEQRLIMQGGIGIPIDEYGNPQPLLGPIVKDDHGRKCLVLDLDETLVHSSFKVMPADFIVPVEIEGTVHNVYVIKRPGVDEFMRRMGEIYEVVVFTASLSKYADPVLDMLDIHHAVRHRLFRESCYNHKGNYVKDLSQLGRDIGDTIIIDNSPASYIFHPNNAVPISSWFNDPHDTELTDLCPFLADLCEVDDVRAVLDGGLF
ncbi:uncharacterized protein PFL1_04614 [Pseudozyma flocculosa PF-1]|nr:uncharacterized protein PFL1_04614 [Pseudozyma flocculosa PF-1]EPQ27870.1 hypothetical protein PFL1_04614 [Pseudozyma flocculosa PF-1]